MITSKQVIAALQTIDDKVSVALSRLKGLEVLVNAHEACTGHSGGKDSVVNYWLVSKIFPNLPVVHTAKPGGDNAIHPRTLEFLYEQPFAIELWPRKLGHNPKYNLQFDGSRTSEKDRNDRSADFVEGGRAVNRQNLRLVVPDSMFGMTFVFPFFDWGDADVWAAIHKYQIKYSEEYVEEKAILKEVSDKAPPPRSSHVHYWHHGIHYGVDLP